MNFFTLKCSTQRAQKERAAELISPAVRDHWRRISCSSIVGMPTMEWNSSAAWSANWRAWWAVRTALIMLPQRNRSACRHSNIGCAKGWLQSAPEFGWYFVGHAPAELERRLRGGHTKTPIPKRLSTRRPTTSGRFPIAKMTTALFGSFLSPSSCSLACLRGGCQLAPELLAPAALASFAPAQPRVLRLWRSHRWEVTQEGGLVHKASHWEPHTTPMLRAGRSAASNAPRWANISQVFLQNRSLTAPTPQTL